MDRPPATAGEPGRGSALMVVRPVRQLRELADFHYQALLSREEYQQQKSSVLDPYSGPQHFMQRWR